MRRVPPVLLLALLVLLEPPVASATDEGWFFALYGGLGAGVGGELIRVESTNPIGVVFETPDGRQLTGKSMKTEIGSSGLAGLRVGRGWGDRMIVAGSVAFTDLDVKATVRSVANNVDEYDYDQVFVVLADLTVSLDWIASGSTPYILAGLGVASLDFEPRVQGVGDVDQTRVGLVLGFGYRLRGSIPGFDVDLDVRDTIVGVDMDAEQERLQAEEYTGADRQHLWQLSASWTYRF